MAHTPHLLITTKVQPRRGEQARDKGESSLAHTPGPEGADSWGATHDLPTPLGTPFVPIEVPDHPPTIPEPPSGFAGGGR